MSDTLDWISVGHTGDLPDGRVKNRHSAYNLDLPVSF